MSEVILTKRLFGVPDGAVYPRWFEEGDTVTGELAAIAVDGGYTEEVKPDESQGIPANVTPTGNAADDVGTDGAVARLLAAQLALAIQGQGASETQTITGADGAPAEGSSDDGQATDDPGNGDDAGEKPSVPPAADDAKSVSTPPPGDDDSDDSEVTIKHVGGGRYGRFVNGERVGETYSSREEAEKGEG